jgi:hypothetical protein
MMEKRHIKIASAAGIVERIIEYSVSEPWELNLLSTSSDGIEYSCVGADLFECLSKLRADYLEIQQQQILCNGARIDVYPSRMSRQMSGGCKAYIMTMGRQARMSDMVDIFEDSEERSKNGTVNEQNEFFRNWKDSLK